MGQAAFAQMARVIKTYPLTGLMLIGSEVYKDERGYFQETYKASDFTALGLPEFKQDNLSFSKAGVLRGLHYQLEPKSQGKLVRVVSGRIFDVAVDVRKDSETFGKWQAVELSAESGEAFFIPEGFAHGFLVMSSEAIVLYKATEEYDKASERGILWNDPKLNIDWPANKPTVSSKDLSLPLFANAEF